MIEITLSIFYTFLLIKILSQDEHLCLIVIGLYLADLLNLVPMLIPTSLKFSSKLHTHTHTHTHGHYPGPSQLYVSLMLIQSQIVSVRSRRCNVFKVPCYLSSKQ